VANDYTDDELAEYAQTFALVHAGAIGNQGKRDVHEAGQLISSGAGQYNSPPQRRRVATVRAPWSASPWSATSHPHVNDRGGRDRPPS
jgi:hypothetical protein